MKIQLFHIGIPYGITKELVRGCLIKCLLKSLFHYQLKVELIVEGTKRQRNYVRYALRATF